MNYRILLYISLFVSYQHINSAKAESNSLMVESLYDDEVDQTLESPKISTTHNAQTFLTITNSYPVISTACSLIAVICSWLAYTNSTRTTIDTQNNKKSDYLCHKCSATLTTIHQNRSRYLICRFCNDTASISPTSKNCPQCKKILKSILRGNQLYFVCPSYPACSYDQGIETLKKVPIGQAMFLLNYPDKTSTYNELSAEKPDVLLPYNHNTPWNCYSPHPLAQNHNL